MSRHREVLRNHRRQSHQSRMELGLRVMLWIATVEQSGSTAEGNFCKAKDKEGAAAKRSSRYQSHRGDRYATPDFTHGRIDDGPLRADYRCLFMLCWAARPSDILIPPAPT